MANPTSPDRAEQYRANRARWDELVAIHASSRFYDLDGFRAGGSSLLPLELQALGDVRGRTLLHLMCHFGLDTLSWARLGARCTGADFSPRAVALAARLAEEQELDARFVCADLYELPSVLQERFDIVFTSYGVLAWLHDLRGWAQTVRRHLAPGGLFCMVEIHPTAMIFDDEDLSQGLRPGYDYFTRQAMAFDDERSYAGSGSVEHQRSYQWTHTMGEVISALAAAGLRIERLQEHPFCCYPAFEGMQRRPDGYWEIPPELCAYPLPLLFTLTARAPQSRGSMRYPTPANQ